MNDKEKEHLSLRKCKNERELMEGNFTLEVRMEYIVKFNKDYLLKKVLKEYKKYNLTIQSFNKIRNPSLFSILLYSDWVKHIIPSILPPVPWPGVALDPKEFLLRMATHIKGGLDMYYRKFKPRKNASVFPVARFSAQAQKIELKKDGTRPNLREKPEVSPDRSGRGPDLNLTISDICMVLYHGNIKDVKILIKNDYLDRNIDSEYSEILNHLCKNEVKVLEYILEIPKLVLSLPFPIDIIKMIWNYTVYSKIFDDKNIKKLLNLAHVPSFTKKLKLMNDVSFINSETLYNSSISKKMIKNFNEKTGTVCFCKYNNFTPLKYSSNLENNDINTIYQMFLRSMKYNSYLITVSINVLEPCVLYDLYPPIPSQHNNKVEYSILSLERGVQVYIITDYYCPGTFKERIDTLSNFHPWANKDFTTLQDEMKALQEFLNSEKPQPSPRCSSSQDKKLWWPRKYITTNFLDALSYPNTLYENNGWLFMDNNGLVLDFNSKYKYIFRNTSWVDNDKLIWESSLDIKEEPEKQYPNGLWKCEWIEFNSYKPIELMDNKFGIGNSCYHLDINKLIQYYNDISIPCNFKARKQVNPSENLPINNPCWASLYSNVTNIGCGMDIIREGAANIDTNPFYTCDKEYCFSSNIVVKYSDWMIDSSDHFIEFAKKIASAEYLYIVMIDADLINGTYYFNDGDENTPQSYIEKLDSTESSDVQCSNEWSCDIYKARGFLSWIHPKPINNQPYEFYITTISFFENNLSKINYGSFNPDWKTFYGYRHSPIVGMVFKNEKPLAAGKWW